MATETRTITVCDECCELLEHSTSGEGELVEIRVEACPECSQPGLKLSKDQLELLRRVIQHVRESRVRPFSLADSADYNDLCGMEDKIKAFLA